MRGDSVVSTPQPRRARNSPLQVTNTASLAKKAARNSNVSRHAMKRGGQIGVLAGTADLIVPGMPAQLFPGLAKGMLAGKW